MLSDAIGGFVKLFHKKEIINKSLKDLERAKILNKQAAEELEKLFSAQVDGENKWFLEMVELDGNKESYDCNCVKENKKLECNCEKV